MKTKTIELTVEEVSTLLKKLEYTYKKKGSPLVDKLKEFVEKHTPKEA